jgi:hypothetical protein
MGLHISSGIDSKGFLALGNALGLALNRWQLVLQLLEVPINTSLYLRTQVQDVPDISLLF